MDRLSELVGALATVPVGMAVVVIGVGLLRMPAAGRSAPAELAASLALALEFLLAAGLLRLSSVDSFSGLAAVAAIILLRKVISTGVRLGVQALGAARVRLIRA